MVSILSHPRAEGRWGRSDPKRGLVDAQRIAHVGSFELDVITGVLSWSDEQYRILRDRPEFGTKPRAVCLIVFRRGRVRADSGVDRRHRAGTAPRCRVPD